MKKSCLKNAELTLKKLITTTADDLTNQKTN